MVTMTFYPGKKEGRKDRRIQNNEHIKRIFHDYQSGKNLFVQNHFNLSGIEWIFNVAIISD